MADNARIKAIVHWLISQGIISSQQELGEKLGISNKSYLSQLVNGRAFSPDFINKLSKLSENINKEWLETGEGSMLISQDNHGGGQHFHGPISGDNPQFAGHDLTNNPPCSVSAELTKAIDAIAAQAELTREAHAIARRAQEQTDRLISLLEKKLGGE